MRQNDHLASSRSMLLTPFSKPSFHVPGQMYLSKSFTSEASMVWTASGFWFW